MITIAFIGKKLLAVNPYEKTGRWFDSREDALPSEILFSKKDLREDVSFLTTNAYIEWFGKAWKQFKGIRTDGIEH